MSFHSEQNYAGRRLWEASVDELYKQEEKWLAAAGERVFDGCFGPEVLTPPIAVIEMAVFVVADMRASHARRSVVAAFSIVVSGQANRRQSHR